MLPDKRQAAVVTLADIREIYKGSATQRAGKLDELKRKLDGLIDEGSWECDDVFDFDDPDTDATVADCIVYYVTGFVSRKLRNTTTCSICKNALQGKQGLASVPEADLVNCKTRGWLTHPNMHLFDFFNTPRNSLPSMQVTGMHTTKLPMPCWRISTSHFLVVRTKKKCLRSRYTTSAYVCVSTVGN